MLLGAIVAAGAGCVGITGAELGSSASLVADASVSSFAEDAGGASSESKMAAVTTNADAGAAGPIFFTEGSPLCKIVQSDDGVFPCDPDAPSCAAYRGAAGVAGADASTPAAADAAGSGVGSLADAGVVLPTACRVTAVRGDAGTSSAAPMCQVAGLGTAESPCYASTDCEAGFECVVSAAKVAGTATNGGVCRHYCCNNVCAEAHAFCDIETTVGEDVAVPVCVAHGSSCQLLNDATCGLAGLTCQVVNDTTGEVACVTPGVAKAGESCETEKCAAGLSCIAGTFPNRQCAQLCNHSNDDCPAGESCTSNTALSDINTQVGVCTQ